MAGAWLMSSPLPSNMALCTVRGRYGQWVSVEGQPAPQFQPFVGMRVTFSPAYPFVTNTTALPSPMVVATAPRTFVTDSAGYLSDPLAGNTRNCQVVASDDPDIYPSGWRYLVTFAGPGSTNFRAFRTFAPSEQTVDMAILTPQRVATGATPTEAEIAAANAAASAAAAQAAVASIRRGQAGGVAPLDADGDVNDAAGNKIRAGGGGGNGHSTLANIDDMSPLARQFNANGLTTTAQMRSVIGAGTGNGDAVDAAVVHKAGAESITGIKTFTVSPVIPTGTVSTAPVTKAQLDAVSVGSTNPTYQEPVTTFLTSASQAAARAAIGAGVGNSNVAIGTTSGSAADAALTNTALAARALDTATVHRTGDEIVSGVKTFSSPLVVPTGTAADQAVNKSQLDGKANTAHSHAVTELTATGTRSATTFLAGDNTWQVPALSSSIITTLQASIDVAPWLLRTSGGVYPPRPATTRSVFFMDPLVQPTNDGQLTGGGGMYPNIDLWFSA